MAYFFIRNNDNILLDKVGESIYLRNYPQSYNQKSSVIAKSTYNDYCAGLDSSNNLHIIYKSSLNSIIHLKETDKGYTSKTILEDTENTYQISNLQVVASDKCFLFYSAKNPYENCIDLIYQPLSSENETTPQALISLPNLNSKYQSMIIGKTILLMCCTLNESKYELNLYTYDLTSNQWNGNESLVISDYPVVDFCFVKTVSDLFLSYVIEKIGHYQLFFGHANQKNFQSKEVLSIGQKIRCKLFLYNDIIWINYLTSQTLFACFSINHGKTFSKPEKCSLQSNSIIEIQMNTENIEPLAGNSFFGYLDHQPHIAVISQIDVDHVLYYSGLNVELQELLHSFKPQPQVPLEDPKHKEEIAELKETQRKITEQYNKLAELARELQEEGKKWKKKYYRALRDNSEPNHPSRSSHSSNSSRMAVSSDTAEPNGLSASSGLSNLSDTVETPSESDSLD